MVRVGRILRMRGCLGRRYCRSWWRPGVLYANYFAASRRPIPRADALLDALIVLGDSLRSPTARWRRSCGSGCWKVFGSTKPGLRLT